MIVALGAKELKAAVFGAVKGPPVSHFQQLRHRQAVGPQTFGEPTGSQLVDELERAEFPVVAEAHGVIDTDDVIGNFRHQPGRVAQGAGQYPPSVQGSLVAQLHHRLEATFPGLGDAF